jgi:excinuclease ABC subunit C
VLISLAKKFEIVYGLRSGEAVEMPRGGAALHLLQRIRDEAHRFAVTYHRLLKEKTLTRSVLDSIPGIGPKRKRVLFEQFDSVEEIKRAGIPTLMGLPGMDRTSAESVFRHFRTVASSIKA